MVPPPFAAELARAAVGIMVKHEGRRSVCAQTGLKPADLQTLEPLAGQTPPTPSSAKMVQTRGRVRTKQTPKLRGLDFNAALPDTSPAEGPEGPDPAMTKRAPSIPDHEAYLPKRLKEGQEQPDATMQGAVRKPPEGPPAEEATHTAETINFRNQRQRGEDELPLPEPEARELTREEFISGLEVEESLPKAQREELCAVPWKYRRVLSPPPRLGLANLSPHEIVTKGRLLSQIPYRVGPATQAVIEAEVVKLLGQGCNRPSPSAWASPWSSSKTQTAWNASLQRS